MKNLATCKPSEFVAQTAKIRTAVANFLDVNEFFKIKNSRPVYRFIPDNATPEQKSQLILENAEIKRDHAVKSFNLLLDNMLSKHPKETLEILALCCFVDPSEVDEHPMDEYFDCLMDILQSKTVMRFFSLLAQLDQSPTSTDLNA